MNTRAVTFAALFVGTIIAAFAMSGLSAGADTADAETQARRAIFGPSGYPANGCETHVSLLVAHYEPEELDRLISAAGGPERSIARVGYAGTPEGAATGKQARVVASEGDLIWAMTKDRQFVYKLRRLTSASGINVWQTVELFGPGGDSCVNANSPLS